MFLLKIFNPIPFIDVKSCMSLIICVCIYISRHVFKYSCIFNNLYCPNTLTRFYYAGYSGYSSKRTALLQRNEKFLLGFLLCFPRPQAMSFIIRPSETMKIHRTFGVRLSSPDFCVHRTRQPVEPITVTSSRRNISYG